MSGLGKKRILSSEGVVAAVGLQPRHFEQHQGDDEKKSIYADFDWVAIQLSMKNKGNVTIEPLAKGTQDVVSFPYQWMLFPPKADEVSLPITTGKKQRVYNCKVIEREVSLTVDAGQFKTLHLINASEKSAVNEREFWLAIERSYLPVKIIMREENGTPINLILIGSLCNRFDKARGQLVHHMVQSGGQHPGVGGTAEHRQAPHEQATAHAQAQYRTHVKSVHRKRSGHIKPHLRTVPRRNRKIGQPPGLPIAAYHYFLGCTGGPR